MFCAVIFGAKQKARGSKEPWAQGAQISVSETAVGAVMLCLDSDLAGGGGAEPALLTTTTCSVRERLPPWSRGSYVSTVSSLLTCRVWFVP